MENVVYLDNSSTTMPCATAVEEIKTALQNDWGNPSSLHLFGFEAERRVDASRKLTAELLDARCDEIYFNSCGSEGNNTAIFGAAAARAKRGNRIVTTSVEHPSVLEPVKRLAEQGFEVIYLKPDSEGHISEKQVYEAVNEKTVLVSMMLVNNETGVIMPVAAAADAVKKAGAPALVHCDAVQAVGKMPVNVTKLGVDLLTASAHKLHGSKGLGILYIKKGVTIKPLIYGGGQEKGLRSGTECVPLICGLGGAIRELPDPEHQLMKQKQLWGFCRDELLSTNLVKINSPDDCLPYILNISVCGYRSETLLHFLEARGIYVSSGSACAKGHGSYVLNEMGLDAKRTDSALRISFSRYNTKDDILKLKQALLEATSKLRRSN